jgi:ABC-type phosphate transport system permease subunit
MSVQPYGTNPPAPLQPASGQAVAALVLGITGIVFCWWGLGTLAQVVLAIAFGVKGMQKADAGLAGGKGMAQAGLVLGIVGACLYLLVGVLTLGAGFLI